MKQNRNLFRLTRFVIFKISFLFRIASKFKTPSKRLLIIKLDEIGDYILFRNFLEIIKKSDKYKDYQIDLLGNKAWKNITISYDQDFVSDCYFINPSELYESPLQCLKLGWRLFRNNYCLSLQPTYTRTLINDGLAALAAGKQTIGFLSDNEHLFQKYKRRTDTFYSTKFILPTEIIFEFDRNRFFFEQVIQSPITLPKPYLPVEHGINKNYVIIFPGAGSVKRRWGNEKFLSLAKLIIEHTGYTIILAGGKSDLPDTNFFMNNLPEGRVSSQIGKTSLTELINLIAGANCVISNDTSAIHIAAACNTPGLCIHGVAHYKRFIPYPKHLSDNLFFVYEKMPCFNCNWNCIFPIEENEVYPCVAINTVESAWEGFLELMKIES